MARNHHKYLSLRKAYPYFEFQSYSFILENQILKLEFFFNISGVHSFNPKLEIDSRAFYHWEKLDRSTMENLVFHIGMVELVSYWKAACSPKVIIKPHKINPQQVSWWKKLYYHGLGEFFYLNGINTSIDEFMVIESQGKSLPKIDIDLNDRQVIVPVGGGKDSAVSLEILKRTDRVILPMALNPRPAITRTIETAGFKMNDSIVVHRTIDPYLIELNSKGYLNGHTPFSALLAFINLLVASGSKARYIALSNESSASQSTIPGTEINHQYSKSLEFESDFRSYVRQYIHHQLTYFSFLRPVNELQIARLFSNYPAHFDGFRSCNVGSKEDRWCGSCPKCLFTDIILSPFLTDEQRFNIFHKKVLDDPSLKSIFDELAGISAIKPFECVGTPEEVKSALYACTERLVEKDVPALLDQFLSSGKPKYWKKHYEELLNRFEPDHFLPGFLENLLKSAISNKNFAQYLGDSFSGINQLLILGYGKEGCSSHHLIRRYFTDLHIGLSDADEHAFDQLDQKTDGNLHIHAGTNYMDVMNQYDLILKSPGIKLHEQNKLIHKLTSQTDLFLRFYRNQVVGVTGTKGKSTTVSLIHHFLISAGKKAVLLGNIGVPAFDLVGEIDDDTLIVFELSAHQLEQISVSPHIAVLLNIFPEHLDHFGSFEAYENAKLNILKHQLAGDKALVGQVNLIEKDSLASDLYLVKQDPKPTIYSPLAGNHNALNIEVALKTVELLGVNREEAIESLKHFKLLPHRLEFAGEYRGIRFYNDSISTIPESTIAAVKTIPGIDTIILGGHDRGLDYSGLVDFLSNSEISNLIFLGKAGDKMIDLFKKLPETTENLFKVDSLEDAFDMIWSKTQKGKVCLLSPAASSYDQFKNFEHRGDLFKNLVKEIE